MPVIAFNLSMSLTILTNALTVFRERCVEGITANEERCRWYVEHSVSLVTALNPRIGYARAAEVVKRAIVARKTILETVIEEGLLSLEEDQELLDTTRITKQKENCLWNNVYFNLFFK